MRESELECTLQELIKLSASYFHCDSERCPHYGEYNQCFGYTHIICPLFEKYRRTGEIANNDKLILKGGNTL